MNPTAPQSEPTLNSRSQAAMTPAKRRRLAADERVLAEHAGVRQIQQEGAR